MVQYAVITDNGGGVNSIYHDVEGEEYTFPVQYRNILKTGTIVVYHRSKKKDNDIPNRLSDESHYFGVAVIGEITPTPDGNLRAQILDYKKFQYPVDIHALTGGYYEINPFWQQGVRATTKDVYDRIVAASHVSPVPAPAKKVRGKGVYSCKTLANKLQISNEFCSKKYKVVTNDKGYYILNIADGTYYELEKPRPFSRSKGNMPDLKVMKGSVSSFLIIHNGIRIGVVSPITNGVEYSSILDKSAKTISIFM